MPQLIVKSLTQEGKFEQNLSRGQVVRIGRKPENGWAVSWDKQISREHADVEWDGTALKVTCLEAARNSIFIGNEPVRSAVIASGTTFVIGQTEFTLVGDPIDIVAEPDAPQASGDVDEHAFNREELKNFQFRDAGQQMELLSELPAILDESRTDADFAARLVELLMQGIPASDAVAVVQYDMPELPDDDDGAATVAGFSVLPEKPSMMRVATRDEYEGRFRPSRRLVLSALTRQESIVHLWNEESEEEGDDGPQFTVSDDLDWAFCTPILSDSTRGWVLYVSGITEGDIEEGDLGGDLRFAELMAQFIASVRSVRTLQETQTQLSSFFSPKVIESLTGENAHLALVPQERDISVLFCDVRGFSKKSEQFKDDLHMLLACVREALSVMANGILDSDGTIADFQGDAALGFWGWPVALEEGPVPACRAALEIQRVFISDDDRGGLLDGFSVGLGVAHGNAIAGHIGTQKQAKVGVFGPVVNQGARLESMTKQYGVSICIDEQSASFCRKFLKPEEGRLRKLAHVRPKGMDSTVVVTELVQPLGTPGTPTDEHINGFEAAVEAVVSGQWASAIEQLNALPDDGAREFLIQHMAKFNNEPPANWDGAFSLDNK
ncbi:MAG: adenylate/guanylate cyclase domain-containing protein [Planctomycetota bacterium]|nr:adenylate/guanylate cyclase domain-containing protein [Planctomycetota bacterium]